MMRASLGFIVPILSLLMFFSYQLWKEVSVIEIFNARNFHRDVFLQRCKKQLRPKLAVNADRNKQKCLQIQLIHAKKQSIGRSSVGRRNFGFKMCSGHVSFELILWDLITRHIFGTGMLEILKNLGIRLKEFTIFFKLNIVSYIFLLQLQTTCFYFFHEIHSSVKYFNQYFFARY